MGIDLREHKLEPVNWLKNRWHKCGVKNGDVLLLHSNILRTLVLLKRKGFKPSTELIFESYLAALGGEGTLVIPLFNWDFTKGTKFDIRYTKSYMGSLTETARRFKKSVRTGHPIYSFCAIGKHSDLFESLDNYSGYGEDSPFGLIRKLNGKIAVLDIEENSSMTFHHHVEEMMLVPYRYSKKFKGQYIDRMGNMSEKTYAIYVRDLGAKVETFLNPLGEKLWKEKIYQGCRPGIGVGLRVGNANNIFSYVKRIIDRGKALGNLYKIGV